MILERLLEFSLIGAEWVLWLLFALSLYSIAVLADRVILYTRTREKIAELEPGLTAALTNGDLDGAKRQVKQDSLVRNVLRAGLDAISAGKRDPGTVEQTMMGALSRERARYEARLTPLATIGNNAPFIGLFGTVLGIIQAFHQLGKLDASQAAGNQLVMSSISEALVATGVGIMVAIPAVAAFNWARSNISARIKHAESLMHAVIVGLSNFETAPVKESSRK